MEVNFIKYNGIKGYSRIMYNDVKDANKYKIEVAYDGKDIKALLEYLFELERKIEKAIEYIKNNREIRTFYTPEQRWEEKKDFIKGYYDLLEILGDKENE